MADIYGHDQATAQKDALNDSLARRRADHLRRGGRPNMPLSTHPSQVHDEEGLIGTLAAIANDPSFVNSLGLMPPADPGMVPSYGHAGSDQGYQYGMHTPMISRGLPPETMSAPAPPEFANTPNPTHANAGAMDPALVQAQQAPQGLDDAERTKLLVALDSLQRQAGNQGGPLKYSGKLKDQPWFNEHVQAAQLLSQVPLEDRKQFGKSMELPTIQNTGKANSDPSFDRFKEFYNSPAQQARRAKNAPQDAQGNVLTKQQIRDQRKERAFNRNNPEIGYMQRMLGQIGGDGGGGAFGPREAMAMGMMGMGGAIPAMANAAVANRDAMLRAEDRRRELGLQERQFGLQEQIARQQAPPDKRTQVIAILSRHGNNAQDAAQDLAQIGVFPHEVPGILATPQGVTPPTGQQAPQAGQPQPQHQGPMIYGVPGAPDREIGPNNWRWMLTRPGDDPNQWQLPFMPEIKGWLDILNGKWPW